MGVGGTYPGGGEGGEVERHGTPYTCFTENRSPAVVRNGESLDPALAGGHHRQWRSEEMKNLFFFFALAASSALAQHGDYGQVQSKYGDDEDAGGYSTPSQITPNEMTRRSNLMMQESINTYNNRSRMEERSSGSEVVYPYQRQINPVSAGNLNHARQEFLSAETEAEKRKAKDNLREVQSSVEQIEYGLE